MSDEFLQTKTKSLFQSSAYRGANGELEPRLPDDCTTTSSNRFSSMISNKLEPFPRDRRGPAVADCLVAPRIHHKSGVMGDTTSLNVIPAPDAMSTIGTVKGRPASLGFLESTTTQQRFRGHFDDDVMKAFREGKEREDQLAAEREALRKAPFATVDPKGYTKSTHEHANFSNMDADSYRPGYNSRYELVTKKGEDVRNKTLTGMLAGNAVDRDALAAHLQEMHERSLPRGYKKPSTSSWQTTTGYVHAPYDVQEANNANSRFGVAPAMTKTATLSAAQLQVTIAAEEGKKRHVEGFETETSDKYQNRASEAAPLDRKHFASGALNVVNGALQMRHQYHKPRSDVVTGETYSPSEIVPGQFNPMSKHVLPAK